MTDKLFVNFTGVIIKDASNDISVIVNVVLSDKDKKTLFKTESGRCNKPINGILEMYSHTLSPSTTQNFFHLILLSTSFD